MRLTRRDALAALVAGGVVVGMDALAPAEPPDAGSRSAGLDDHAVETLAAVAEVVYPDAVSGVSAFVRQYSVTRAEARPSYADGVREAITTLDDYAVEWFDWRVVDLPPADRDALLDQMSVDVADPDPDGVDRERVRYYVVNELLFALYATPTGGKLVGIENPQGYPGGTASYQRGPKS